MNKKMMKFSLLSVSLILTSAGAVTSAIPSMSATYVTRSLSAVELLTTAPSFMVTIFVLISSFIARKIGQKQTVIIGLVIASICGILPLFSQSYSIVLASRAGQVSHFPHGCFCPLISIYPTPWIVTLNMEG